MTPPVDDLDRLMAVMTAAFDPAFGEAWTRRQVEDSLIIGNSHYLLVDSNGAHPAPDYPAAGFSLSRTGFEEEELLLFAVDPLARRQGLGRRMLAELAIAARARGARRLLLEMRQGNPAEALYRRFGFVPIGQRSNYYKMLNGERVDAITFAVDLG